MGVEALKLFFCSQTASFQRSFILFLYGWLKEKKDISTAASVIKKSEFLL